MRKIVHIDMDCFYAAVETKFRPELRGKPVGVGGPPNTRSVLCTANYEARKFNVRSAMPSSRAVRLCPDLILIPPDFAKYRNESRKAFEIFRRYTDLIEPLSLDEAYLDVTDCKEHSGSATLIAYSIRKAIFEELQLTASAGIAPNKFLAKVASDWNKPNGQFVVKPDQVDEFAKNLPVEKIFGVGKVTAKKMHALGLKTCGDIRKQPLWQLQNWFGSRATELLDYSFGKDDRPVHPRSERKSFSLEETFSQDLPDLKSCQDQIKGLYEDLIERLNQQPKYTDRISGAVIKLKFFDFTSTTCENICQGVPTMEQFYTLLEKAWWRKATAVRLIGLGFRLRTENGQKDSSTGACDQFSFF